MKRLYSQLAPPWSRIFSRSMWHVQPVVLMVGSPDEVAPRVTDTDMEAPEALASKLPWSLTGKMM